jgi:aryl-alcohol dehydrogenase-like predicted oxidoreductase
MTLPELAIRFALDTPGLDVVLVGIGSPEELATAVAARDRAPPHPITMARHCRLRHGAP